MRPLSLADLPAVTALQEHFDTHWFGAPENDAAELAEALGRATAGVLVDGGAAWLFAGTEVHCVVDPAHPGAWDVLLPWLREQGAPHVEVLAADVDGTAAAARHGWEAHHSSYELLAPAQEFSAPLWPEGVRATGWTGQDALVHDLVYRRAQWASVVGHGDRPLEQWRDLFLTDGFVPEQQVLAWQGEELLGAALGRTFADGSGWVAQLAVAAEHRGRGLGRALLLEALRRRVAGGAVRVGLGVSAQNPGALRLYQGVGLVVDREWVEHHPV